MTVDDGTVALHPQGTKEPPGSDSVHMEWTQVHTLLKRTVGRCNAQALGVPLRNCYQYYQGCLGTPAAHRQPETRQVWPVEEPKTDQGFPPAEGCFPDIFET